jgi:hypothetical protein
MNTFQVEELVSHGYVVAAIDQPYAAAEVVFPDGRQIDGLGKDQLNPLLQQSIRPVTNAPSLNGQTLKDGIIPYFAQDAVFTLDQLGSLNQADPNGILTGHLDLQRAGIFGVSLGGIVSPEACHLEPCLRACLVMEAPMPADVVKASLHQPSMWILSNAVRGGSSAGRSLILMNIKPPCAPCSRVCQKTATSCRCRGCSTST